MAIFMTAEDFYVCVGGLLEKVRTDPTLFYQLADSGIVVRFRHMEPEACVTIDARPGVNRILYDDEDSTPDVELRMKADLAHWFWMGKVNVMAEVFAGRIAHRGSLSKLSKLLPVVKPAMELYPEHLRAIGREDLLRIARETGEAK